MIAPRQRQTYRNAAGLLLFTAVGSELLFEVFSQRYERGATLVTSNLLFDEWTSIFGSERLTGALLDRLTHHVHILEMNWESYRLATSKKAQRRPAQRHGQNPKTPNIWRSCRQSVNQYVSRGKLRFVVFHGSLPLLAKYGDSYRRMGSLRQRCTPCMAAWVRRMVSSPCIHP
jgi:IstB-like ATP binding protein